MAYQVYEIYRNGTTSNYGTYIKSVADEIASTVPGITLESITTDTESTYDGIYSIEGMTACKLRIYNETNSRRMYIKIGNDVNYSGGGDGATIEKYYYSRSGYLDNLSYSLKINFIISDGMYFMRITFPGSGGSYSTLAFGLLTSKVDGSKIEVRLRDEVGKVMKNGDIGRDIIIGLPYIDSIQIQAIPSGTFYLMEGIIATSSANAAKPPYGINGNSIYNIFYTPNAVNNPSMITNGTDYFYFFNSNYSNGRGTGFRLS